MHRFLETNFQKVVEVDLQTFVCETLHQKLFEENALFPIFRKIRVLYPWYFSSHTMQLNNKKEILR